MAARSLLTLGLFLLVSCRAPVSHGVLRVTGETPDYHRLRYLDGQVSLNARCGVRLENPLNPKIAPLYVNGAPVGFC